MASETDTNQRVTDPMMGLGHKVAVVTGASRGVGRGIALALGEQGATVYVTARSIRVYNYADDLGSGMLSCYGQRHFRTPDIDRLGNERSAWNERQAQ